MLPGRPRSVLNCIKMPVDRHTVGSRGIEAVGPLQVILLARLINERKSLFPLGEVSVPAASTLRRKNQAKEDRSPREQPGTSTSSAHRKASNTQKLVLRSLRSPRSMPCRASADRLGLLHSKHSPTFKQRTSRQVIAKHNFLTYNASFAVLTFASFSRTSMEPIPSFGCSLDSFNVINASFLRCIPCHAEREQLT